MPKKCFDCGEEKSLDEFHKQSGAADGRRGMCKACTKSYMAGYRLKNYDRIREQEKERGNGQDYNYHLDYNRKNPEKYAARIATKSAVRNGTLKNPGHCEMPGCTSTSVLHKHHPDYSKPLEVEWLCPACHSGRHKNA